MYFIISSFIIGGVSLFILFGLYSQLSEILVFYNSEFSKRFQETLDVALMYKTYKKTNIKKEKDILVASMIFYSITFISIVVGIVLIFTVDF